MVVIIKCLDTGNLVRVDEEGRLWGDLTPKRLSENPGRLDYLFEVQQKGNTFSLKSQNSNKYIDIDKTLHFKYLSPQGTNFSVEGEALFVSQSPKGYLSITSTGELVVLPTSSTCSPYRLSVVKRDSSHAPMGQEDSDESSEDSKNDVSPPMTEQVTTDANTGAKTNDKKGKYGDLGQNKRVAAIAQNSRKKKFNSTSTLFVQDTIASPNIDQLLYCVCKWISIKVANGHERPAPFFLDIFDETTHPISKNKPLLKPPTDDDVYTFLSSIFKAMNLNPECAIVCLVYIERLVNLTGVSLHATNWRRIILSTLILASKVWEDLAVWNADFLHLFRGLSVAHLNELEKYLLNYLQFNVTVKASLYVKYYFDVRELAPPEFSETFTALNKDAASRLEENSHIHEEKTRVKSQSVEMSGKTAATPNFVLN